MLNWEQQVKPYLMVTGDTPTKELLHPFYYASVSYKKSISELLSREYPDFMNIARPRETDGQKKYRKDIYENPVRVAFERIFDYVRNIPKNADYKIKYADEKATQTDTFKNYVKEKFNREGDLEGWLWENGINMASIDPNAVMVLLPVESDNDTQLRSVKGKFLGCENVWMHQKQEFAVVLSDEKSQLIGQLYEENYTGKILYFFDHESYTIAVQKSGANDSSSTNKWDILGVGVDENLGMTFTPPLHYCDGLPVRKLGKILEKSLYSNKYELFRHELDSVFAFIKSAIRRYNDKEIEANTALNSLHWRKKTPCNNCNGTGKVKIFIDGENDSVETTCKRCNGTGHSFAMNSMDVHIVDDQVSDGWEGSKMIAQAQAPGGSVQNTPVNLMALRTEFENEFCAIFHNKGLSSLLPIHFAQSGTAKKEDKEGATRFGTEWANHVCKNLLSWAFWCTASIRYGIGGNQLDLMPEISEPRQFNLDTKEEVGNQLKDAISNKMDEGVIDTIQLKYLKLEASEDSEAYRRYELRMLLDGFRGITSEEKSFMLSSEFALGDRTSESFTQKVKALYFSINFNKIYQDAIIDYLDFHEKKLSEKRDILNKISENYLSILPAEKPLESFSQRSAVNLQDRKQITN